MTAILPPPAWCFVLWCPVARQPQGRQHERCPAVLGPRWRPRGEASRRVAKKREEEAAMLRDAGAASTPAHVGAGHLHEHYAAR